MLFFIALLACGPPDEVLPPDQQGGMGGAPSPEGGAPVPEAPIDASWSSGMAVTVEHIEELCAETDAEGQGSGLLADGSVVLSGSAGATIEGSWTLSGGDTLRVDARQLVTSEDPATGERKTLSENALQASYTGIRVFDGEEGTKLLAGQQDGRWYVSGDCGTGNWEENQGLVWDQDLVQVIDAEGGSELVIQAVTALLDAGEAIVLPGFKAREPREGTEILTRGSGDYTALKEALEQAGFEPVVVTPWAESPAPVVIAVGPNTAPPPEEQQP